MPERVGPYRVVGALGAGGVGVVYEASDDRLGRPIAIKVLHDSSPENAARFRREARAMSRVNHPNVATVYEVGETDDGQGYIAMELVRGATLREWLRQGQGWAEILATVRQAGEGLAAAHAAGLVHRDFKPDNVLVGHDGRVRVVDFGLAKHQTELSREGVLDRAALARELADGGITRTGNLMGTPAYMAPEQFLGAGDARSDQFSLCVVLYEALYGRLPFAGDTAEELFDATTHGHLRAWPKRDDLPIGLRGVLRRGLSADAADRYDSMRELLEALTRAMVDGDGTPRRRPRTKGTRSWRWRIVGAATGLLLAAGDAWLRPAHDEAEAETEAVSVQTEQAAEAEPTPPTAGDAEADREATAERGDDDVHARTARAARRSRRARAERAAQS